MPVSISGRNEPMDSINGGRFRSAAGTVNNGDHLRLRMRYPSLDFRPPLLASEATSAGGISDSWTIRVLRGR